MCGVFASVFALFMPGYQYGYILFVLVRFAQQGILLSTNVAGIYYSKGDNIPILVATTGLTSAPVYVISSIVAGFLANKYSVNLVFSIGALAYISVAVLSYIFYQTNRRDIA